jgi:hypothetical protein
MNKSLFAASIPALALAAMVCAPSAAGQAYQGASKQDATSQSQTEEPRLPATKGEPDADAQQAPDASKKMDSGEAKKHPPTSGMDSATPRGKSPAARPDSAKHPPTSAMDRAVPTEKSPDAQDSDAQGSNGAASSAGGK